MKKIVVLLFFLVSIFCYAIENSDYKDLGKDHWAYNAVETLINKGVLKKDGDYFNGEQKVSRNEMATYLSKALEKLEDEKASKDDLLIIENLIYEFSKDLNSYGFNVDKYVSKIKELESAIDQNKLVSDSLTAKSSDLEKRVTELERLLSDKSNKKEKIDLLRYSELTLENTVAYGKNIYKNPLKNEFRNLYKIKFILNYKDYEAGIKTSNNFYENEDIVFMAKGQKKIDGKYNFGFHTKGYMERYNSYYDNIEYINNRVKIDTSDTTAVPYKEGFESIGVNAGTDYFNAAIENIDDKNFAISKFDTKYLKYLTIYELEEKKLEYEAALRLPILKDKFSIGGGYSSTEKDVNKNYQSIGGKVDINYINGDIDFNLSGNRYNIGYERKKGDSILYDGLYAKAYFELTDHTNVVYKGEYIKPLTDESKKYLNQYIVLNTKIYGFDVYVNYNIIGFNKDDYNLAGSTKGFNANQYKKDTEYTEMITKARYKIFNKVAADIGYRVIDLKNSTDNIIFTQLSYLFNDDTIIFVKYTKNSNNNAYLYNDLKRDINGDIYNIDFDENSSVIPFFKDGVAEVGLKLKF